MLRTHQQLHNMRHSLDRQSKNNRAYQKIENKTIIKYRSDLLIIPFAVTPSNQYLCSLAKTKSYHVNGKIKYPANRRSTQFYFPYTSQEGSIGDIDDVLCQQSQKNRIGYLKYVFVRSQVRYNYCFTILFVLQKYKKERDKQAVENRYK